MPLQSKLLAVAGAVLAAFVFGAWGAWAVQTVRMNHAIDALKLSHSEASHKATQAALERYTQMERTKDEAIAAHAVLAAKNAADAASAKRTADSLRRDLASVPGRISAASERSVREYATSASIVLDQCTAEVAELARIADGHAADLRLMLESWPK